MAELDGAPPDQVAQALYNRGGSKGMLGDYAGEMEDYTRAAELDGAPADQVAKALYNRGVSKGMLGDYAGEMEDYTRAAELDGAPADQVAKALNNRGVRKGMLGDYAGAIEDYTRAAELDGAPADHVARALNNRGAEKGNSGDHEAAYADFLASLKVEGASAAGRVDPGSGALFACLLLEDTGRLEQVAALVAQSSRGLAGDERLKVFMGILLAVATPKYADKWPAVWLSLLEACDDDMVAEGLKSLAPVADVLETGDHSKLDPLPPEQREFVEEVLKKFERTETPAANSEPENKNP